MSVKELSQIKFVAADVDGTLLYNRATPEMVAVLHQLTGVYPLALISGSSYQALERKIVTDLARGENEFDVYASGGSVRMTYGCGQPIYDTTHAQDVRISGDLVQSVKDLVEQSARNANFWGDDWLEQADFLQRYRQWAISKSEGSVPENINTWNVSLSTPGQIHEHSALRIEVRHDPIGRRMVGLSIKSVPRVLDGVQTKFVPRLAENLGRQLHGIQILPAGFASIDVNMGNGHKGVAIEHILKSHSLQPNQILYFGDELREGNDRVVREMGVSCIDVSAGGPSKTLSYLKDILNGRNS